MAMNPQMRRNFEEEDTTYEWQVTKYKDARVLNSLDEKNQIGGCLFFFIGSVVLGFAIFLIKSGVNSQRIQEIDDYI